MQSSILASLGKVAGVAGISLGVFLLLFQGVLEKQFLPQAGLNWAQAFAVQYRDHLENRKFQTLLIAGAGFEPETSC